MRTFVLIGIAIAAYCLASAVTAEDVKERVKAVAKSCNSENGVGEEEVAKFRQGQMPDTEVKDNLKCAMNCVMVKMGFMNDAGKFNPETFKITFVNNDNKAKITQALDKCKGLQGPNPCETAFLIGSCMMKEKMEMDNM